MNRRKIFFRKRDEIRREVGTGRKENIRVRTNWNHNGWLIVYRLCMISRILDGNEVEGKVISGLG